MPDLGPAYYKLSANEQSSVMRAVDVLTRQFPDCASDLTVSSDFGSVTLNVKAPAGRDMQIQSEMMSPITDIMLDTGILIVLLVSRRD